MDNDPVPDGLTGSIVIEAGAYEGTWAAKAAERGCHVYAFEPATRAYAIAKVRLAGRPNAHLFPVALGGGYHVATLHDCQRDGATWLPADGPSEPVQVVDVALVLSLLGRVDLMHLNAEGGEVDILERLVDTGQIRDVAATMVQWHPRPETNERIAALEAALQRTHVKLPLYHCWGYWRRKGAGGE